jgi:hypothetical protein
MTPIRLVGALLFLAASVPGRAQKPATPEWEEPGCGIVREDLHLAPEALIRDFVRRDRAGEFMRTSAWLERATLCPVHLGGPDTFKIASRWKIKRAGPRRFRVTYFIEGTVDYRQVDGKLRSFFHPVKKTLEEDSEVVQTPWGWKMATPWNDAKVSAAAALHNAEQSLAPFEPQSLAAVRLLQNREFAAGYRTVLSRERKLGPNFDGRYRLAQIGCGAGCGMLAIIDCRSGDVFDPDLYVVDSSTVGFDRPRVEFDATSATFTVRGCLNEDEKRCGTYRYRWDGRDLAPAGQ